MKKEEIVTFVQDRLQQVQEDKRLREPELNGNIAYYMGDQWIKYNSGTGLLMAMRQTTPNRHTRNVIQPLVDTITGQIVSSTQHLVCRPNSNEIDDIYGAEIASTVLESEVWRGLGVRKALLKIMPIMATTGSIVLHPFYNYKAGKTIKKETINEKMGENYWTDDQNEGKLQWDILSPFEVSTDTSSLDDESSQWWCVSKYLSITEIKELWGKEVDATTPDYMRLSNAFQRFIDTVEERHIDRKLENSALVHRFWHKPCKDFPKGLFAVIVDSGKQETCIYNSDLPWGLAETGDLPFVKIDYKSILGRRWGIAPVTQARPAQKRINIMLTQWQTFKGRYMFPPVLNPSDSGVTEQQLVNKAGEWIDYTPSMASDRGGVPHYLIPPQFNPQFFQDMEQEKNAVMESFGINGYMSGAGSARTSGRGISLMQSASEARISPVQVALEEGFSRFGSLCLQIIENTYTIPRLIKIAGESKAREVQDFTGDMLKGNHNTIVEFSSYLPLNKQSAIDVVNTWWTNQIIPHDEEGRKVANKMLQTESFSPFYSSSRTEAQARYENAMLDKGTLGEMQEVPQQEMPQNMESQMPQNQVDMENQVPQDMQVQAQMNDIQDRQQNMYGQPEPQRQKQMVQKGMPRNEWDNDEVHIKVHEERQQEISFLKLCEANPQVKEAYELHKAEHRQAIVTKEELVMQQQQQGMQQQQQQMAMQEQMAKQHEQDLMVIDTEGKKEIMQLQAQIDSMEMEMQNKLDIIKEEFILKLEASLQQGQQNVNTY